MWWFFSLATHTLLQMFSYPIASSLSPLIALCPFLRNGGVWWSLVSHGSAAETPSSPFLKGFRKLLYVAFSHGFECHFSMFSGSVTLTKRFPILCLRQSLNSIFGFQPHAFVHIVSTWCLHAYLRSYGLPFLDLKHLFINWKNGFFFINGKWIFQIWVTHDFSAS